MRAVVIAVFLSMLPSAVVAARRLMPPAVTQAAGNSQPMNYEAMSSPPAETTWNVPDYPTIGAMRVTVVHTLRLCETEFEGLEGTV